MDASRKASTAHLGARRAGPRAGTVRREPMAHGSSVAVAPAQRWAPIRCAALHAPSAQPRRRCTRACRASTHTASIVHAHAIFSPACDHARSPRTRILERISKWDRNLSGQFRDLTTPRTPLPSPSRCPLTEPAAVRAGGRRSGRAVGGECTPDRVSQPRPAQPHRAPLTACSPPSQVGGADGGSGAHPPGAVPCEWP